MEVPLRAWNAEGRTDLEEREAACPPVVRVAAGRFGEVRHQPQTSAHRVIDLPALSAGGLLLGYRQDHQRDARYAGEQGAAGA